MPNIELPENYTPGDVFRAIADWYDRTGELMPGGINIHHHSRDVGGPEYVDVLAERYGAERKHMSRTPGLGSTISVSVDLDHGPRGDDRRPLVSLNAYRTMTAED